MRRNTFLDKFKEHGLEYEIQDCSVCINSTVMMSRLAIQNKECIITLLLCKLLMILYASVWGVLSISHANVILNQLHGY